MAAEVSYRVGDADPRLQSIDCPSSCNVLGRISRGVTEHASQIIPDYYDQLVASSNVGSCQASSCGRPHTNQHMRETSGIGTERAVGDHSQPTRKVQVKAALKPKPKPPNTDIYVEIDHRKLKLIPAMENKPVHGVIKKLFADTSTWWTSRRRRCSIMENNAISIEECSTYSKLRQRDCTDTHPDWRLTKANKDKFLTFVQFKVTVKGLQLIQLHSR